MTDEIVKPEDLKPGDRVRLIVDATVAASDGKGVDFALRGPLAKVATITRLPPPVDPDLLLARKVVVAQNRAQRLDAWADEVEAGQHDDGDEVAPALAAIKAAKEQS
jgi:hypothetical protein